LETEQHRTPLFDTVLKHARKRTVSFHTPGHKNGRSIDRRLTDFIGKNIFFMDVTVFSEVDSLHDPKGPIKKAQELAAKAYGAKYSFFLVNGSSCGVQSMLLAACNPGDQIILSRNTHKSVMGGIILSEAAPIYLQPLMHESLHVLYDLSARQIEEAIKKYPQAKAVFISRPTYNGICSDIKEIARITRKYKKLLLVDEAWGTHLRFHPGFPASALEAGADMVVQSVHKIGSAMSQGSILHVNSDRVDVNRVRKVVSMLQTTSPSYIILASLDLARRQLAVEGKIRLSKLLKLLNKSSEEMNRIKGVSCLRKTDLMDGYSLDHTKLTINCSELGLTGYEVSKYLTEKYNIQVDCENFYNLIAIAGLGTDKSDLDKLVAAIRDIAAKYGRKKPLEPLPPLSFKTEMAMPPVETLTKKTRRITFKHAIGMISAEIFSIYPPGIPVLVPGERITREVYEYLKELNKINIGIKGKKNSLSREIEVIDTKR
jgi:arginine decarboxylase